jgi:zinc protease
MLMRLFRPFLILVLFFLTVPLTSFSYEGKTAKHVLDSGLTILISEMPASPVVSVYALVKTGSATEGKFLGSGISHFVEHMLFKGTHGLELGEIAGQIQAVGGTINAATSFDYTIYTITVPFDAFDVALKIQADMLMNATMDKEEVEKEREVIFGEIRLYKDNPDRTLSEWTFKNVYLYHPYQHPIIGYEDLLKKITQQDLMEYYKAKYTPNNMVFSIAGNVDEDEALAKVKEVFKDFQRQPEVSRVLASEPQQIAPRRFDGSYPTDLSRLAVCFSGVSVLDKDMYALDLLAKILGDGQSSRLYKEIYKKQNLVYSVNAGNFTPIDRGVFEVEMLLETKNREKAIEALIIEIEQVKAKGVEREELEKVKRQVVTEHVMGQQTSSEVAYAQAFDEAYMGDPHFSDKYVEAVKGVDAAQIQYVAKKYLTRERMTIVSMNPQEKAEVLQSKDALTKTFPIQKHVLDNGLTVLLREDHTFPVVSMRLSLNGGLRQEPQSLNGLSVLMTNLWLKGSKSFSAEKISQLTESRGILLGSISGKNSFGVGMEFLPEDLKFSLDLLSDLVLNPTFPPKEIPQIKEAMKAAIRSREDSISAKTSIALYQTLFTKHPFRAEEGGTVESVDKISREEIVDFYHRLAAPNNMILAVYGDIDPKEILEDVRKKFSTLKEIDVGLQWFHEPEIDAAREKNQTMDKEQAMVLVGFHGPEFKSEDHEGVEVLSSILGSSFSGRLFNTVREKFGQAYTLGGGYIPSLDTGVISFYVLTTDEKADEVKNLIFQEIQKIRREFVGGKELADMKTYLKGNYKADNQTNSALNFTSSLDELYGLGFERYLSFDERINAVTKEDVLRLAQKYLDPQKSVVVITRPQKN